VSENFFKSFLTKNRAPQENPHLQEKPAPLTRVSRIFSKKIKKFLKKYCKEEKNVIYYDTVEV